MLAHREDEGVADPRRSIAVVRTTVLAVLAAIPVASGCAGGEDLNTRQVERAMEAGLESQTGASGVDVECPAEVELEEGATFECVATSGDEEATLVARQLDDSGRVTWRVRR
jgi:hypothetical protein